MSGLFPLTVAGATSRRAGHQLVGPVDLTLGGEGVTVVIGPNGSGKTTLLRLLHGAARLSSGRLDWACSTEEARRRQAFVFQQPVMMRRSVLDNIAYPLTVRGMKRAAARAQARVWGERVGLGEMLDRAAPVLSGGERQKLAIARALIAEPELVFLDEPCAALDGRAMREIEEILGAARANGTRLILSTHDMGQARRMADDILFLSGGGIAEHSRASDFFPEPQSQAARDYLNGKILV